MQIVSNRNTYFAWNVKPFLVCVCGWGGGGGGGLGEVILDPFTFTTLWANSAEDNLFVLLNYRSLNVVLLF